MTQAMPVTRVGASCRRMRLSGDDPGAFCGPREQALLYRQHLADPDARDDLATWGWDTESMRDALVRLDFAAVLVICRSAARLPRRELGERTGVSESAIWDGVEVEWHHLPTSRQRGEPGQIPVAHLAYLAVLAGGPDGNDAALGAGAKEAGRG